LKTNIDKYLWVVLNILGSIQIALKHLSETNLDPKIIDYLLEIFESHESIKSKKDSGQIEECRILIKDTCAYLFRSQKIYAGFPYDDKSWLSAWENAKTQWEKSTTHKFPEVKKVEEPIPALLIQQNWQKKLYEKYEEYIRGGTKEELGLTQHPITRIPRERLILSIFPFVTTISYLAYTIYFVFETSAKTSLLAADKSEMLITILFAISLSVINYRVYYETFRKSPLPGENNFNWVYTLYLAILGLGATISFWIF
jgi:hypothetical protein